jgi:hypothetical protein
MSRPEWREQAVDGGGSFWEIAGRDCVIILTARPHYCDRGKWLAQLHARYGTELARDLDDADRWPRYYFDLERAKLEIEAWLVKRRQVKP